MCDHGFKDIRLHAVQWHSVRRTLAISYVEVRGRSDDVMG